MVIFWWFVVVCGISMDQVLIVSINLSLDLQMAAITAK